MDVWDFEGPDVETYSCTKGDNQQWIWSSTDKTLRSKHNNECLTLVPQLEVWAGPLANGSQAVLLLNRGTGNEPMTVHWSDIGFRADHSATVRDLWTRQDLGTFAGNYTSPNLNSHSVMMLKVTPTK